MSIIGKDQVIDTVAAMSDIIIANEIPFCELDSAAGDGDFGMSVAKGFRQVKAEWEGLDRDDIGTFLTSVGMIVMEYCGGASGPLWGSAFRGMGRYAQGKEELALAELGEMLQAAVSAIQKRGGAQLGDKTLLDALIPLTETIKAKATKGEALKPALEAAVDAAEAGAEKTKTMTARKGRATYVGERSLDFPDAGAMAVAIIARQLLKK